MVDGLHSYIKQRAMIEFLAAEEISSPEIRTQLQSVDGDNTIDIR